MPAEDKRYAVVEQHGPFPRFVIEVEGEPLGRYHNNPMSFDTHEGAQFIVDLLNEAYEAGCAQRRCNGSER